MGGYGFQPAERRYQRQDGSIGVSHRAKGSEVWKRRDAAGSLLLRLEWLESELWLADADDLLLNADARGLSTVGIWGFDTRGVPYYRPAVRAGNFTPGQFLELRPEPLNVHDLNAVGVAAVGAPSVAGLRE